MCWGNCKWIITQYHIRMHKRHASFHNSDCKLFFLQISHKSHQMVLISVPMNPPSCSRQAVFSFSFTFSSTFCHYFTPYPTHSLSPSQLRWFSFSYWICHNAFLWAWHVDKQKSYSKCINSKPYSIKIKINILLKFIVEKFGMTRVIYVSIYSPSWEWRGFTCRVRSSDSLVSSHFALSGHRVPRLSFTVLLLPARHHHWQLSIIHF